LGDIKGEINELDKSMIVSEDEMYEWAKKYGSSSDEEPEKKEPNHEDAPF
jgi:hypothetical protein